jgi:hypothetical protein
MLVGKTASGSLNATTATQRRKQRARVALSRNTIASTPVAALSAIAAVCLQVHASEFVFADLTRRECTAHTRVRTCVRIVNRCGDTGTTCEREKHKAP